MTTTHLANVPLKGLSTIQDFFPGKTAKSTSTLMELVKKNDDFDIFFNDKGFHNHLDHHIYAAYSLGADSQRLHTIFKYHTNYQRPRKPVHPLRITKENFNKHLSDRSYWGDYQQFFQKELSHSNNTMDILNEYLLQNEMLIRVTSGAVHPLIHIGYGLEFNDQLTLSEGLAMCAVTSEGLRPVVEPLLHSVKSDPKHIRKSPKDIWREMLTDDRFYNLTKLEDNDRRDDFFARHGDKVLNEYIAQFHIEPTEEDIKKNYVELFELIVMAYAAITPLDKTFKFDFFIMHGLTSIYFLPLFFKYLSLENSATLLRIYFATVSIYWITSGRPKFYLEKLLHYTPLHDPQKENPWLTIIEGALSTEDVHQCKVLRSLIWAAGYLGDYNGLWLKAAQATVDHVRGIPGSPATQDWSYLKLGYEESWKTEKSIE